MVAQEHLNEDQSYVAGRSTERVRDLVERATAAGIDASEIITTSFGYIVPTAILEKGEAASEERSNTLAEGAGSEADEETEVAAKADAEDAAQEADAEEAKVERKTKARKADTEEGK